MLFQVDKANIWNQVLSVRSFRPLTSSFDSRGGVESESIMPGFVTVQGRYTHGFAEAGSF